MAHVKGIKTIVIFVHEKDRMTDVITIIHTLSTSIKTQCNRAKRLELIATATSNDRRHYGICRH